MKETVPTCQVVYHSLADWEGLRQRPQHLAYELSLSAPTVYVRPVPLSQLVRSPGRRLRPLTEHIQEQLVVVRPRIGSPGRLALMARINEPRIAAAVQEHLDPARPVVLWLSHPDQAGQIGRYGERLVVYDMMDDHVAFKEGEARATTAAAELALLRRADLVFTSSQALQSRAEAVGARVLLVPNGVEFDRFALAVTQPLPIPDDIAPLPHPRLLYYGTLGPWVDTRVIAGIATARRNWSILLIGPQAGADLTSVSQLANVHLVGPRPYHSLPAYLQHADVCLLPFLVNDLTRAVDPVKVYEYLAAGKSMVASPLPELEKCGDLIERAMTPEAAIAAIERALLTSDDATVVKKRLDFAAAHTWQARAAVIREALDTALRERSR